MSHQRWIWGCRCMQVTKHASEGSILTLKQMSSEVSNNGISDTIKITHVLFFFKKYTSCTQKATGDCRFPYQQLNVFIQKHLSELSQKGITKLAICFVARQIGSFYISNPLLGSTETSNWLCFHSPLCLSRLKNPSSSSLCLYNMILLLMNSQTLLSCSKWFYVSKYQLGYRMFFPFYS